ncbi:MAG: type IX secretion system membrane protein PorP/SprF [Bacteroidales bacterium]
MKMNIKNISCDVRNGHLSLLKAEKNAAICNGEPASFMKCVLLALVMITWYATDEAYSQQMPVYTQFMFNSYVFNPAVAGTHNYYQVRLNSRFQWVGMTDPPQTNSLSVYGPHATKDMGFGGHVYNDITGPTSRIGMYGSYAYNLLINESMRLSMGLSAGAIQNRVDGTKIGLLDPSDQALLYAVSSKFSPDATLGLYLYASSFHVGFSAHQLFGNTVNLFDLETGLNKLKTNFYLTGGYKYFINFDYALEPSVIVRGSMPAAPQVDFSLKAYYQNMVWLGVSVRSQDAVSFLLGYTHENKFHFGYSYDMSFSPIRHHNSGSHEVFLGMRFNPVKQ